MFTSNRSFVLAVCIGVVLLLLACDLGSLAQPAAPTLVLPATAPAAPPLATATTASVAPSAPTFTLKLPNGQSVALSVSKCDGVAAGQYLELRATNTQDLKDANRVEVQVAGNHPSAGKSDKIFVSVIMGAQDKWTFTGNTPSAQITLDANGAGRFADVAVVNAAGNSPNYQMGREYKFGAEWTCK